MGFAPFPIGSPPLAGASSEARSFAASAFGLESSRRLPLQAPGLRPRTWPTGRSDGGLILRSSRASAREAEDRSVARGETLDRLSTSRRSSEQAFLGESQRMPLRRGVFSQAREAELGPGGEWQLSPSGGLVGRPSSDPRKGEGARSSGREREGWPASSGQPEELVEVERLAFLPGGRSSPLA